jgi:hypothetical protein
MKPDNPDQDFVQSCITTISFPETLEAVQDMVQKNQDMGGWLTDMDTLLSFQRNDIIYWTAPKWMTQGDILFFYYAKKARVRVVALYRQTFQDRFDNNLKELLKRTVEQSSQYAGTIFGCAEVSGVAEYSQSELYHFGSRFFAPIDRFHVFEHPLSSEEFADYVKIGQNTTTPLYGQQFDGIKKLLAVRNRLPDFLHKAYLGISSFRTINQDNWPTIACASSARFIHEAQIRAYFVDYFLKEVKDKGTPLLEECQCYRDGDKTGIVDYFVKVHNRWVPVEAKLNMLAERDVLAQIAKYTRVDWFVPTKGTHRTKRFEADKHSSCIVIDQSGIYVTIDGRFVSCNPGVPIWQRAELSHSMVVGIREWIRNHCY